MITFEVNTEGTPFLAFVIIDISSFIANSITSCTESEEKIDDYNVLTNKETLHEGPETPIGKCHLRMDKLPGVEYIE